MLASLVIGYPGIHLLAEINKKLHSTLFQIVCPSRKFRSFTVLHVQMVVSKRMVNHPVRHRKIKSIDDFLLISIS